MVINMEKLNLKWVSETKGEDYKKGRKGHVASNLGQSSTGTKQGGQSV